jgi:hypothetical protein
VAVGMFALTSLWYDVTVPNICISEFSGNLVSGAPAALRLPPLAEQMILLATTLIRILADAACAIAIGDDADALAKSMRLAAGVAEVFTVEPGSKLTAMAEPGDKPADIGI